MKKYLIVTGGAGFIGSNLIEYLLLKTKYKIISIDNYSSGTKKNHIKNPRVHYFRGDTKEISKILKNYSNKIVSLFHFGEFARIYQSFKNYDMCMDSNIQGSNEVFKFCLKHKIKLIYSATSAIFGRKGSDRNLSPYAFSKATNLENLNNLKNWFNFKFEVIYFYNVYGPRQIMTGEMATIIGIFEYQYKRKKNLTVVKPGTQSRRFTHVLDTIKVCYDAWKSDKCKHYLITHRKSYSILEVAKMFNTKTKFLPPRAGERYNSSVTEGIFGQKIIKKFGKISLKDHITSFIKMKI
tara:strand:- start:165 stop:1049 length:885 start_codon:yes stop_codon:yes gene_type:complete